ncbi:MAG TPA: FkbM family methyltransferase [Opitutaceae bacterium]|nr:FkbM family methyltransferase [Opitutaceae bacterium]HND60129.1 FkbM family methyltransferase [Opitutaceae bacterium]
MNALAAKAIDSILIHSGLQYWPVRVRAGVAAGARWTLYPWTSYWRGTHEPALQAAMIGLGDIAGWHCWDLGAHYGIYSVGLARRVGPGGSVAAFEPNPHSHARLRRHAEMNGLDHLHTFAAAVSDHATGADLLTYGDLRSTTTHLAYEQETLGPATEPVRVPTVVLDDWVKAGRLNRPNFIKVDVEGHAHRALAGAVKALAASRPILIIAFHSREEVDGVRAVLDPLGYDRRVIATDSGSADPEIGHDFIFTPQAR